MFKRVKQKHLNTHIYPVNLKAIMALGTGTVTPHVDYSLWLYYINHTFLYLDAYDHFNPQCNSTAF